MQLKRSSTSYNIILIHRSSAPRDPREAISSVVNSADTFALANCARVACSLWNLEPARLRGYRNFISDAGTCYIDRYIKGGYRWR